MNYFLLVDSGLEESLSSLVYPIGSPNNPMITQMNHKTAQNHDRETRLEDLGRVGMEGGKREQREGENRVHYTLVGAVKQLT